MIIAKAPRIPTIYPPESGPLAHTFVYETLVLLAPPPPPAVPLDVLDAAAAGSTVVAPGFIRPNVLPSEEDRLGRHGRGRGSQWWHRTSDPLYCMC